MEYKLHKLDLNYDKNFKIKSKNKQRIEIDAISKKLFNKKQKETARLAKQTKNYSLEYHIVGSTFFKERNDDNDKDYIEIEGKTYLISDGRASFTKGYLYVGNNEFVRVATRIPFILLFILFIILIMGLLFALHSCSNSNNDSYIKPTETSVVLPIDGTDSGSTVPNQTSHSENMEEYIEISVFPEIVVDSTTPNIPLYNSENNTVYFVFKIYENETLLHQTGLIPPGYRVQWNAKDVLNVGTHDLTFVIECSDVDTLAPCDGATTHCVVIVE